MAAPTTKNPSHQPVSLVTGANGHLGNNIVRKLCLQGQTVRAGVRNLKNVAPFDGLNCGLVHADINDEQSMIKAMAGVDVVYAVAAVLKLWTKDPIREVYDVNMACTRVLMAAAKTAGVRRIVYVSSVSALNFETVPTSETRGFNTDRRIVYCNSKNDTEKLAIQLAQELSLDVVVVLPGALVGSHCFSLNESYRALHTICSGGTPVAPNIYINWCDVKDVAKGCIAAAMHGVNGERYILAQEVSTSIEETTRIIPELFPLRNLKTPYQLPRIVIWTIAWLMEKVAAMTGSAPALQTAFIDMFWGVRIDCDTSKARNQLGYHMKDVRTTLEDAVEYLDKHPNLTAS